VIAQSQNFGVVGSGAVSVISTAGPQINLVQQFQTPDSCFDACFSEANQNQVLSAGGNGTLKLFQLGQP
jgi:peroxin-7